MEDNLQLIDNFYLEWKNSVMRKNKNIRDIILTFAQKNKEIIIANGELAYNIIIGEDHEHAFYNTELLTFFIHQKDIAKIFNYELFANTRIIFSDLLQDDHSRDIIYYVPKSGFDDPMKIVLAKFFVIQNDYKIRIDNNYKVSVINPEYLFIDWYNTISQPREIASVEKWKAIHEKLNNLQEKYTISLSSKMEKNNPHRITKLEEYCKNNKSIIMVGDYAACTLINNFAHFRKYKFLIIDSFYEIKQDIARILQKFGYRYTKNNEFIMHYHGPFLEFANKNGDVILEMYVSQEQCIPAFEYNGYQLARFPNIMKYLFLEDVSEKRNVLIKNLLDAQKSHYEKNKKTPFDDGVFQVYDVRCVGEYTSLVRKKRIKIYKSKLPENRGARRSPKPLVGGPAFPLTP